MGSRCEASSVSRRELPREVWYDLEEALELLSVLEDASAAMTNTGHLAEVMTVEAQIRILSRKLEFDDPEAPDGR
jgi:hypothetical protein